jgi:hypothetical protein
LVKTSKNGKIFLICVDCICPKKAWVWVLSESVGILEKNSLKLKNNFLGKNF